MFSDLCFICFFTAVTVEPGLLLEMADNLLLCMDEAFPDARSRECVYLLTLRQGHSPARVRGRERKGEREREEEWRERAEEWKAKASAMQMGALQPWIIQSVEWKSCFSDPPVINFCRSGPFSFGLFWPAHLPFCTTPSSPYSLSHPLQ